MGKRIIPQARGHGGPTYRAPSFRYKGRAALKPMTGVDMIQGIITDIMKCPGHTAPLVEVKYADGEKCLLLAPEGVKVGDEILCNTDEIKPGNTCFLKDIPDGTLVYNIEQNPGDGGKFCRSSGTTAKVLTKSEKGIIIQLPSKKQKVFRSNCRANIGVLAGSGRTDKPFLKAGKKYHAMRAKNKLYPKVCGLSMNSVDHPFGGSASHQKGRSLSVPKNAPPGRKVGLLRPRRTGRKKK